MTRIWAGTVVYTVGGTSPYFDGTAVISETSRFIFEANGPTRVAISWTTIFTRPCQFSAAETTSTEHGFLAGTVDALGNAIGNGSVSVASNGSYVIRTPGVWVNRTTDTESCTGSKTHTTGAVFQSWDEIGEPAGTYTGSGPLVGAERCFVQAEGQHTCSNRSAPTPSIGWTDQVAWFMSPCAANLDTDADGLSDCDETDRLTDPRNPDSDGDGLEDGDEVTRGTDPLNGDTDQDDLSDGDEVQLGTNPLNADTDGDGYPDGLEVELGTRPLDPNDPGDDPDDPICDGHVTEASTVAAVRVVGTDLFEFGATVPWRWCGDDAQLGPVTVHNDIVANAVIEGALQILGFTLEYGPTSQRVEPREEGPGAEVEVSGTFNTCFSALTALDHLGLGVGRFATQVGKKVAGAWLTAVKRGVPPDHLARYVLERLGKEFDQYIKQIINSVSARIDELLAVFPTSVRRFLDSDLADAIVFKAVVLVRDAALLSVGAIVDQLIQQLNTVGVVSKELAETLFGNWATGAIEGQMALLKPCYEMWSPVLTFSMFSNSQPTLNVSDTFLNPFLEVSGSITSHE